MNQRPPSITLAASGLLAMLLLACTGAPKHGPSLHFARQISPILNQHCIQCHGIEEREGGLDLRTLRGILRGGQSGPAIVWGEPENSLLLKMVINEEMPAKGPPLSTNEIDYIERWIRQKPDAIR